MALFHNYGEERMILYEPEERQLHHNLCKRAVTKSESTLKPMFLAFYKEVQPFEQKEERLEEDYFAF